jgi:hypothetical protein
MIRAFSNTDFTKTEWHTEMKLTPLEGELPKIFCSMQEM